MEELCGSIMTMKVEDEVETPVESESPNCSPGTADSSRFMS